MDRGGGWVALRDRRPSLSPARVHHEPLSNGLAEAEWTQPGAQAANDTNGAHLQGTLRLKSRPRPTSWDGCQAGGQSRALGPGVWPRLPSLQHTQRHPTGGQKPRGLPDGSARLARAPSGPARGPQQWHLLFRGPIVANSPACRRPGQRDFSTGVQTDIVSAGPPLAAWPCRPRSGGSQRPSGSGPDWRSCSNPSAWAARSSTGGRPENN